MMALNQPHLFIFFASVCVVYKSRLHYYERLICAQYET